MGRMGLNDPDTRRRLIHPSRRTRALLVILAGCACLVAAAAVAWGLAPALTTAGGALVALGLLVDVDPRPAAGPPGGR